MLIVRTDWHLHKEQPRVESMLDCFDASIMVFCVVENVARQIGCSGAPWEPLQVQGRIRHYVADAGKYISSGRQRQPADLHLPRGSFWN